MPPPVCHLGQCLSRLGSQARDETNAISLPCDYVSLHTVHASYSICRRPKCKSAADQKEKLVAGVNAKQISSSAVTVGARS